MSTCRRKQKCTDDLQTRRVGSYLLTQDQETISLNLNPDFSRRSFGRQIYVP